MPYRRYRNMDPRWLSARFASTCPKCGKRIKEGDEIYYFPRGRQAYCQDCGQPEYRRLLAEDSMERFGTDCAYDY